ncbi:MAG: LPS-assembly protein LptD [Gemmatimonadaceae bacterium]|nr:LPS-assembly protein LptD [Gemmatimonadaceae bacterium]
MRGRRATLLLLLLCSSAPLSLRAQQPAPSIVPLPPVARRDSVPRPRADAARPPGDSASRDTVSRANFTPADSVIQRLLGTPGYSKTRYQGDTVTFDANTRALQFIGKGMVQRDSQLVKCDSISYSGVGSAVQCGRAGTGNRNVFVIPGQAPIISTGAATYDIARRSAAVSGVRTSIPQSGETLNITGERVRAVLPPATDTLAGANSATYYVRSGTVTACEDSIPDYYFKANEIKRTGTFVVARPAVLYIGDVPVLWLPFLFQDIRSGRHSGILPPNVGVSDIVRNSASYRRNVEGLGYYVSINDFLDAQAFVDWRSSSGQGTLNDPGYSRYNGEFRYKWLERYVTGQLAYAYTRQATSSNQALSWSHQQAFTRNSTLTTNVNLVKNTQLQRQTTVNPYAALATISSQANYQQKVGPASLSLGFTQKQYPGRTQLDRSFPTFTVSTSPLNLGSWLTWTPNVNYSSTQSLGIDQPSALGLLLRTGRTDAGRDTVFGDTLRRAAYTSQLSLDSPLQIFGYALGNRISINSARNDFPEREIVTHVITGVESERIYAQTYRTEIDWTPSFTLPPIARNNLNLSPSLSFTNVDGGALVVRNERTGGRWVHQTKRPTFGLGASPTLYGLFGGFGPFSAIRHSISPTLGYSFAPSAQVSDEYLAAVGRTKYSPTRGDTSGYLGSLAQNALTLGFSTNIEAKTKTLNDSNPDKGEKLKLVSLNFTSVSYDFERARKIGDWRRGITNQNFGYTVRSDLLPGIDFGVDYSLFEGSTLSDTAKLKPYRERVTGSLSFGRTANPFVVFSRLFGRAVEPTAANADRNNPPPDERYARQVASQPVAGRASRTSAFLPTTTQGWQASFTFTSARQRPPGGNPRNVVAFDPTVRCQQFNTQALRLAYDQCVANARTNPSPETPITSGSIGSPIFLTPPTTSLGSNLNMNLTEKWAASWQTQYDFEQHNFASQVVSLQRDLHDWRATFAFTQSPNGSFAFNFLVSLKAEPDLKFDYRKATYRNEGLTGSSGLP